MSLFFDLALVTKFTDCIVGLCDEVAPIFPISFCSILT